MTASLLDRLPVDDRRAVISAAIRQRFQRQEVICREGDLAESMHIIARGRVAVRVGTPLGDVATLAIHGAGDVFGEQALVSPGRRRNATVVALEPVETFMLGRSEFNRLRREHAELERFLVDMLSRRLTEVSQRLVEAMYSAADVRVRRRLAHLADLYRSDPEGPTRVTVTQDDLATLAGTSRPTVNRVLRELEASGVLRLGRGRIEVLDPQWLLRR